MSNWGYEFTGGLVDNASEAGVQEVMILSISKEVTMNNVWMLTISTVFSALFVLAVPIVRAQDMVKVAPKNCKVLLDNDRVRVIRVVTKPGEKLEKHSHPDYIIYALTPGKRKFTSADGKREERALKAGQTVWSDAVTHTVENTGTTEDRTLVIELKK